MGSADAPVVRKLREIREFFVHEFNGLAIFVLVAFVALATHVVVLWLEEWGVPRYLVFPVQLMEFALIVSDCGLFLRFLYKRFLELWKRL